MNTLTLWLAGDVMTGRGIDQIQAHARAAGAVRELGARCARDYVQLAERVNGPVPAQLDIVPMQLRRLQLTHPAARSSLQALFKNEGQKLGTEVQAQADGSWQLRW